MKSWNQRLLAAARHLIGDPKISFLEAWVKYDVGRYRLRAIKVCRCEGMTDAEILRMYPAAEEKYGERMPQTEFVIGDVVDLRTYIDASGVARRSCSVRCDGTDTVFIDLTKLTPSAFGNWQLGHTVGVALGSAKYHNVTLELAQ